MTQPPRPTRPALSREYIAFQALKLVDEEGLEAFTMRRLAARLEVNPMAFYHYFPTKGDLFDALVEVLYQEASVSADNGGPAVDQILGLYRGMRRVFLTHPQVLPLVATRPANTPATLLLVERLVGLLDEAGVSPDHQLDGMTLLTTFTIGQALAQAAPEAGGASSKTAVPPSLEKRLREGGYSPDWQYETGLRSLLKALIAEPDEP